MTAAPRPRSRSAVKRLPSGRHGIPVEQIRSHQRQRLILAIASTCADAGYTAMTVGEIVAAAGVSRKAFYDFFESKEDGLLAAYDEFRGRLFAAIDVACEQAADRPRRTGAALDATLAFCAENIAAAQLLTFGILSAGKLGAARYYGTIDDLSARARGPGSSGRPADPGPGPEWGVVATICAVLGRATLDDDPSAILALGDDIAAMLVNLEASLRSN